MNDQPLQLADGTLVYPDKRVVSPVQQIAEVASETKARATLSHLRTSIGDLPIDVKLSNPFTALITYELIGLPDADIAFLLDANIPRIEGLRQTSDYKRMKDFIVERVFEVEREDAKAFLSQHTMKAAKKVVSTVDAEGALGYMASKDLLQMTGVGQKQSSERLMNALEIVITKKDNKDEVEQEIRVSFNGDK